MKPIYTAVLITMILPMIHLPFHSSDTQWYILTASDRIIAFVWCVSFFILSPKENINLRSLLAVSVIFTGLRVCYYVLWLNSGINDLFVYPMAFVLSCFFFGMTSLKSYNHKSDPISKDNIMLCFWKPKNNITIFHSLVGSAIGSVALYHDGFLYGFRWSNDKYMVRKFYKEDVTRKFITIDTGVQMTDEIESELKKTIGTNANWFGIKFLRFKCVFTIRNVLSILGHQFKPSFFELIPALYAVKIFRWVNER
jgi:TctA family transporter